MLMCRWIWREVYIAALGQRKATPRCRNIDANYSITPTQLYCSICHQPPASDHDASRAVPVVQVVGVPSKTLKMRLNPSVCDSVAPLPAP